MRHYIEAVHRLYEFQESDKPTYDLTVIMERIIGGEPKKGLVDHLTGLSKAELIAQLLNYRPTARHGNIWKGESGDTQFYMRISSADHELTPGETEDIDRLLKSHFSEN